MSITNSDLVTGWSTRYETQFLNEYNQSVAVNMARLSPLLMTENIGDNQGNIVQLNWLGAAPQMRQWIDEKRAQGLNTNAFSLTISRYEASIEIDLDTLRDGRGNIYTPRIREMAQNGAARLPYNLVSDLIVNAASTQCYDNQYFFDTDHSEGSSGTQSNLLTGTGVTAAALTADYFTAKTALFGFKDDKGVPLNPVDFRPIIYIPNNATMVQRFTELAGSTILSNSTNIMQGAFADVIVDPRLTDTNDWYMFRPSTTMKSFVLIEREPVHYEDNFGGTSDDVFKRRVGMASVVGRMGATYGMWQNAVKITN